MDEPIDVRQHLLAAVLAGAAIPQDLFRWLLSADVAELREFSGGCMRNADKADNEKVATILRLTARWVDELVRAAAEAAEQSGRTG